MGSVVAGVVAASLALSACQDSGGTNAGDGPSSTSTAGSTSTASASSSSPAAPSPTARALPSNGRCALIGRAKASELLGAAARGSAATVKAATHIDGCTYVSTAGNLGYDVNVATASATSFIAAAKKAAKGPITVYPVSGGDASFAFTLAIGGRTMARAEVASGRYLVAVNGVAASPAKAKQVTAAALQLLLAAVA